MHRIAIIDVDTSHAWVMGNYLRASSRARVSHVVDAGLCWPESHTRRMAAALDAEYAATVAELVGRIDGALLLGVRYDRVLERAAPLIQARLPIFIDKPAGGTIGQVAALQKLVDDGYPLLCGSSMAYCPEVERIAKLVQGGAPSALAVMGSREFFEHGIHGADIAMRIVQAPVKRVSWSTFGASELLWVEVDAPVQVALTVEASANWCLAANGVAGNAVAKVNVGFHRDCHYARLMHAFLDLVDGRPVPHSPHWHLQALRLLIAGARSRDLGHVVSVDDLSPQDGFDGEAFAAEYADRCRHSANPEGTLQPAPEMFTVAPEFAGLAALNRSQWLRMHTRDAMMRMLGERGKRVVKKVLRRA